MKLYLDSPSSVTLRQGWVSIDLRKTFRGTDCNLHSLVPIQGGVGRKVAVHVREEAQVGHVIIHDQAFLPFLTVSQEAQQVLMSHSTENLNFDSKFRLCLRAPHFQPFHSNLHKELTDLNFVILHYGGLHRLINTTF